MAPAHRRVDVLRHGLRRRLAVFLSQSRGDREMLRILLQHVLVRHAPLLASIRDVAKGAEQHLVALNFFR